MQDHVLYQTGDTDAPESIKDGNGSVVLGLCRHCGAAERDLDEVPHCPGRKLRDRDAK